MHARRVFVLALLAGGVALAVVLIPQGPATSPRAAPRLLTTSTTAPTTTTTSTIPPGNLPQTKKFPSAKDPAFLSRMRLLVEAVAKDKPSIAWPAFFPLAAYVQVKAIADPVTDWHVRLLADYDADIRTVRSTLGPKVDTATFSSVSVAPGATWVLPGVEYNKGSYWRDYGTVVYCRVGGEIRHFVITSMISWRGEWYVVHLGKIR